jgi:hypothetical protein
MAGDATCKSYIGINRCVRVSFELPARGTLRFDRCVYVCVCVCVCSVFAACKSCLAEDM